MDKTRDRAQVMAIKYHSILSIARIYPVIA